MEMEFAYEVKGATLPTINNAHHQPHRLRQMGNKSRMSHIDVKDASIMASEIQPRHQ